MDWLIAYDDLMCARVRHCLICGRQADGVAWHDIAEVGPASVAYTVCNRCWDHEGCRATLRTLLAARYKET